MTAQEMKLLGRYQAALGLHGLRGIALHKAAKMALRAANAAAFETAPGSQRGTKKWKEGSLAAAHQRAIDAIKDQARAKR